MEGWNLRAARLAAGLTAADVALAAGTSESNVAAYERGAKKPSRRLEERLTNIISAGALSPIIVYRLVTVPAAAANLRAGIRAGWPTADLLGIVRECLSNSKWLSSDADEDAYYARPSSTGDPRWDALLAGVVEDHLLRLNKVAPNWTADIRPLERFWFLGNLRGMDAWSFAHTPPSLKVRGVILDRRSLESV